MGKSDSSEMTKWAVGGMQFKTEHEQYQGFIFLVLSPLHPTPSPFRGTEAKTTWGVTCTPLTQAM